MTWQDPKKFYEVWKSQMKNQGFSLLPGKLSIHSEQAVKFWINILQAEGWIIDVLQNGLRPDFGNPPTDYAEDNNNSARRNMTVLKQKVEEWEEGGFVKRCHSPPPFINPLTVAEKLDKVSGTKKLRPCIDMSRCLNTSTCKRANMCTCQYITVSAGRCANPSHMHPDHPHYSLTLC